MAFGNQNGGEYARYIHLADRVAAKFGRHLTDPKLERDDIRQMARLCLVELETEGKIADGQAIGMKIERRLIDKLRVEGVFNRNGIPNEPLIERRGEFDLEQFAGGGYEPVAWDDLEKLLEKYVRLEKDKEVIRQMYVHCLTQSEIARAWGVSQSMIAHRKERAFMQIEAGLGKEKDIGVPLEDHHIKVLYLYYKGRSYTKIAEELEMSKSMVQRRMDQAKARLGADSAVEAVGIGIKQGIIR